MTLHDGASGQVPADEAMSRGKFALALGFCVLGIAILFTLGTWQVERLQWKEGIIERIDARMHADPIPLQEVSRLFAETGDVDYVPVTLTGRFLHRGERFFLSTYEGRAGWNVFTPLQTGSGDLVFVNRGWVPYDERDPAVRMAGQVDGAVTVTGLARNAPEEKPGTFVPDNDPSQETFFWRDLDAMAEGLTLGSDVRLVPFFVDADETPNPGGLPVGGQTVLSIPNNHLQYAITWYGIGLVLVVMTGMLIWRHRRATRARRS